MSWGLSFGETDCSTGAEFSVQSGTGPEAETVIRTCRACVGPEVLPSSKNKQWKLLPVIVDVAAKLVKVCKYRLGCHSLTSGDPAKSLFLVFLHVCTICLS